VAPDIVLIGPLAVGKTTVGAALSARLGHPQVSMDDVRWGFYDELGYDAAEADRRFAEGETMPDRLAYGRPFEVHAIERLMAVTVRGVVDLGASNSVFDDEQLLARVERALMPAAVVLLMPYPDAEASIELLADRLTQIVAAKGEPLSPTLLQLNEYFVRHPANRRLADVVVHTGERTPEELTDEIVHRLR
jgi:hypothetical protein